MIKYTVIAYLILVFLMFYELNLALNTKKILEKRVEGISTQIKEIDAYQVEISNLNNY